MSVAIFFATRIVFEIFNDKENTYYSNSIMPPRSETKKMMFKTRNHLYIWDMEWKELKKWQIVILRN